jgi:hypothetical protein
LIGLEAIGTDPIDDSEEIKPSAARCRAQHGYKRWPRLSDAAGSEIRTQQHHSNVAISCIHVARDSAPR